jgi:hypothetical protein
VAASIRYAFYLASSWLWCIGAFLPLLLWQDFGTPVIVVFTLVNMAGAAWFGFHFRNGSDAAFRQRQRPAINLFSIVTVAFQIFFVGWLGSIVGQLWLLPLMLGLIAAFYRAQRMISGLAVLVFLLSVALLAWFGRDGMQLPAAGASPYWLHAVLPLTLGFILSPYLDITFHRAYRAAPHPRLAFALGFGVLFPVLLGFVFFYAEPLAAVFAGASGVTVALYPVLAFIVLQTAFTAAVHLREYAAFNAEAGTEPAKLPVLDVLLMALVAATVCSLWGGVRVASIDMTLAELIYRLFLYSYGLVFPLLVWRGGFNRSFWLLILLTTPGFALGFLWGDSLTPLLSVSMLILAGAAVYARIGSSRHSASCSG